ncbi:dihydroflavonal-4-reductase [Penicillium waksmanii]|uniref:dihydroflavonal-4-reductase n=1 Tax=Penicillium waksmanii TaxID=69791 RepID=UPI002546FBCB|nr:dihydroflavonal-4-reductase [Penicillium waksmanii]KAJ5982888.1 dihydroflavonal-4-reductase [Penicillium waksmanii]
MLTPGAVIKDVENTGTNFAVNLSMTVPEGFPGHAVMYSVSKILAHQATRGFVKNQAPHFKVITFHPTFVKGKSIIWETAEDKAVLNAFGNVWVHVLNVAAAHVRILEKDIESGTEIILSHLAVSWKESVSFVKENYPGIECKLQPPFEDYWTAETTTVDKGLGIKWRSPYNNQGSYRSADTS